MEKLKSLERLEDSFSKLPSIGRKSAERMSFAVLDMEKEDVEEFAKSLLAVKENITRCPSCGMISDSNVCPICDDTSRDNSTIMVVSTPKDVIALEKSNGYHGLYHVLNGEICLAKGKSADDLSIAKLIERIKEGKVKEIILATNPTIDGETTALYLSKILEPYNIKTTRLAYGLQMGGNLDYTDQLTLLKALEGRTKI